MGLCLEGCLPLGLSRVHILNSLHSSLGIHPINGLLQTLKISLRTIRMQRV
jgi:hypothetical protein